MSRGRAAFKESDLTRALRAVTKAGLTVYGVQLKDGEINLILHETAGPSESGPSKALREWREKRDAREAMRNAESGTELVQRARKKLYL